ncbi:MAG: pectinesterase family protein [Nitrospira sp.]|nr:pectinesterase family protein [Nitrospira sp.]MDE0486423.1 pectinesterase family protein [Nitrospira sp.]
MKSIISVGALLVLFGANVLLAQEQRGSGDGTSGTGSTWNVALDGSGHFTSIQEAIDQAQDGDTVFIKAGRYAEDVTVHSKEGLKVIGEGPEKVFLAGLKRVGTLHIGKWPYGATNVEIRGLTVQQHGGLGVGIFNGSGVTLKNLKVNGFVFGQQVQNVHVEDCVIGGSETTGIAFADSQATLIDNLIHDNDHGVSVGGTSIVHLERNVITRSLFEAVLVADQGNTTLIQNTLVGNQGGVKFQDDATGRVAGNIIDEAQVGIAWSVKNEVAVAHNGLYQVTVKYQVDGQTASSESQAFSDVYVAPKFVAPDRGDYRLQADSPLLNVGGFPFLGAFGPVR